MATWKTVRKLALALPGAEESTSYGAPAFKVKGKLFARKLEEGKAIVVKVDFAEREALVESEPETFVVTDHYLNYPMVIVRLASVDPGELEELIEESWRRAAPKRLLADYDDAS